MKPRPQVVVTLLFLAFVSQSFLPQALAARIRAEDFPTFSMTPSKISVGTTRDVKITISKGDLSEYEPQAPPESSGITFEKTGDKLFRLANDNKSMIIRVIADSEAEAGSVQIIIQKTDGSDVHSFELQVSNRVNAGPTPDDIKEVDAMWDVEPYNVTKVNFGRRVADMFYEIPVTIGNNSGFDLQLVGVGFKNTLGLASVDQYGRPLQIAVDEHNNPLLDEQGDKLVRVLDKDGKPMTIDGTANGAPVYRPLRTYHVPTTDHRLVRGAIEFEQLYGRRALTINLIAGIGTFVSGFIPFFHALGPKANFSSFSSILNGQLKEGFGIAAPDLTVNQLNRLESVGLRNDLIIPNNRVARTTVFFPRGIIELNDTEKKQIAKGSMYPLMSKLGQMVIVGTPLISFKNREIVAKRPGEITPPQPPAAPAPRGIISLARVAGNNINTRALTQDEAAHAKQVLTITGSNLLEVSEVRVGNLVATIVETTRTQSSMDVEIPEGAQTGDVTITRPNGSPTKVGTVHLLPRVVNVSAQFAKAGEDITIEGANLADVALVTIEGDSAEIKSKETGKLIITLLEGTHSGVMTLTSSTALGLPPVQLAHPFTMQPVITEINPPRGGTGTKVRITGYNFDSVSQVKFGDVVAETIGETSNTSLVATVPPTATSGPISVITVHDLVGKSPKPFTFVALPSVPEFPTAVVAGQDLTITGTNLSNVRELKIGSVVIPLSAIKENTPTKITVTVPVGTPNGKITITTDGGSIQSKDPLVITAPS